MLVILPFPLWNLSILYYDLKNSNIGLTEFGMNGQQQANPSISICDKCLEACLSHLSTQALTGVHSTLLPLTLLRYALLGVGSTIISRQETISCALWTVSAVVP